MKGKAILVLLVCCDLVTWNLANGSFLNQPDDYVEEVKLRNVDLDRLRLLRKYAFAGVGKARRNVNDELENWKGRWMPDRPAYPTPRTNAYSQKQQLPGSSASVHAIPMGQPSPDCDDAKTNLTVDWNRSPINHTCYEKKITPDKDTIAHKYCERIPSTYVATHKCMHDKIEYDQDVPLFGPHRPLWPVYGEYKFLPRQRWLHSLEHGGIVALYHPCASPLEIQRLKSLVTGCLRRHVISPYNLLTEERPLALVAWGCRLTMSYVNPHLVTAFIRDHALRGPEDITRDGDFEDGLLSRAKIVSDLDDTNLCPKVRV